MTQVFAEFGEVDSTRIVYDRDSGRSKGFGYVEFKSDEAAQAALDKANSDGIEISGRYVNLDRAQKRQQRPSFGNSGGNNFAKSEPGQPQKTVFVKNLSWDSTGKQ